MLEDGGRDRVLDIGPLDVRDYLYAAKGQGLVAGQCKGPSHGRPYSVDQTDDVDGCCDHREMVANDEMLRY